MSTLNTTVLLRWRNLKTEIEARSPADKLVLYDTIRRDIEDVVKQSNVQEVTTNG